MGLLACATALDPVSAEEPLAPTCPEETVIPPYDRDEWGRWRDADRDCQDTRAEVLIRDSRVPVTFAEGGECRVVAGDWLDPYTGLVVTDASLIDVDHVVPLEETHLSGGWAWEREKKRDYANDTTNLVAAGRSANRSKGSRGPKAWLPTFDGTRCGYLDQWVATKTKWSLAEDDGEAAVIGYMQATCRGGKIPHLPQEPAT
jgi:5-methylcytosine-specific restriction endonuclease McrA